MSQNPRWLFLLGALSACGGERPADGDTDTDAEPECLGDAFCPAGRICEAEVCVDGDRNNALAEAVAVLQNEVVEGEINPAGDVDWYAYTAVKPEWVRIQTITEDVEDGLDTVVAIYAANGALHAWIDDYATGDVSNYDSLLYAWLPSAGTWFVTVEDRTSFLAGLTPTGAPHFSYSLEITGFGSFTRESDSVAAPSSNVEMTSGSSIWAVGVVLESPGDADWISVEMPFDDAPFEIWGLPDLSGSDAIPRVRVHHGDDLLLEKDRVGPEGAAVYFDGADTTYVVEATDALSGGGGNHWYVLFFRTRESGSQVWEPENEPNDSLEAAEPLTVTAQTTSGGTPYEAAYLRGRLDEDGDEDWFSLDMSAGELLSVRCTGDNAGSLTDLALDVIGPDGALVTSDLEGNGSTPDIINIGPVAAGSHALRFWSEDAVYGPGAYYRCNVFATLFEVAD